jgi:hypothetical protein
MWIGELVAGVLLLVIAFFMFRAARPRDGVQPRFMRIRGVTLVYTWSCLLAVFIGGTFVIHSILSN